MSGTTLSTGDITRVIVALQELIKASYLTQQTLSAGLTVNQTAVMRSYTVATLPTTAATGTLVFASNGRNTGEGSGSGTGTLCVWNGTAFVAVWSGVAVTS